MLAQISDLKILSPHKLLLVREQTMRNLVNVCAYACSPVYALYHAFIYAHKLTCICNTVFTVEPHTV